MASSYKNRSAAHFLLLFHCIIYIFARIFLFINMHSQPWICANGLTSGRKSNDFSKCMCKLYSDLKIHSVAAVISIWWPVHEICKRILKAQMLCYFNSSFFIISHVILVSTFFKLSDDDVWYYWVLYLGCAFIIMHITTCLCWYKPFVILIIVIAFHDVFSMVYVA